MGIFLIHSTLKVLRPLRCRSNIWLCVILLILPYMQLWNEFGHISRCRRTPVPKLHRCWQENHIGSQHRHVLHFHLHLRYHPLLRWSHRHHWCSLHLHSHLRRLFIDPFHLCFNLLTVLILELNPHNVILLDQVVYSVDHVFFHWEFRPIVSSDVSSSLKTENQYPNWRDAVIYCSIAKILRLAKLLSCYSWALTNCPNLWVQCRLLTTLW